MILFLWSCAKIKSSALLKCRMRLKQQILWMKKIILFINFYFKWLHQIIVVEFLSC